MPSVFFEVVGCMPSSGFVVFEIRDTAGGKTQVRWLFEEVDVYG